MRFSIQEAGKAKRFFHLPADAQKETGVHHSLIKEVLARNNSSYHRKSDNKLFFIQKESPIKLLTVQGKDFFSLEEIQSEFGLSSTVFMNQIRNQKFPHEIDWISPEILFPGESVSEAKNEKSEVEFLREEMKKKLNEFEFCLEKMQKKFDEFESFRKEMKKENELLSARVLKLEQEKEMQVSQERNSPPEKIKETSFAEMKIPFDTSKKFLAATFDSAKHFAKYIRFGIIGQLGVNGPRKNKMITLDGKIIYVPDLLKEIISSHLNNQMWKDGDDDAKMEFIEKFITINIDSKTKGGKMGNKSTFVGKIRRLEEETIHDIFVEFMKFI